jgi:hypothetical protein
MTANNKIQVHFTNHRDSRVLPVKVSPLCTGQLALDGLLAQGPNGRFLDPAPAGRTYELAIKRTSQSIPPTMTFQQAGVVDGDYIEVRLGGQGA